MSADEWDGEWEQIAALRRIANALETTPANEILKCARVSADQIRRVVREDFERCPWCDGGRNRAAEPIVHDECQLADLLEILEEL